MTKTAVEEKKHDLYADVHHLRYFNGVEVPKRYVVSSLAFIGVVWFYTVRLNLSVAIVAMLGNKNFSLVQDCSTHLDHNITHAQDGEFEWDSELQGIVLGSFYYGYILTQVVGGQMAERFGGKLTFAVGLFVTSALSLGTAPAARYSVYALVALRVLEGLSGGLIVAASSVVVGKWTPVEERTRQKTLVISGSYMGAAVSQQLTTVLSASTFLGGWPSAFYVMGLCGVLTSVIWMVVVKESPDEAAALSSKLRDHLKHVVASKQPPPPWGKILLSPPFWAFCIAHTANTWSIYTLMAFLPTYAKQILHLDIRMNGLLTSIPFLLGWILMNIGAILSDVVIKRKWCSRTAVRKIITAVGHFSMGGFLIAAGYTSCDTKLNITCFVLSLGLGSLVFTGTFVNALDIAPKYTGTIFGIANTVGTLPGFFGPYSAGVLISDNPTQENWRKVFFLVAGFCFLGGLSFVLFASGEPQPWAEKKSTKWHHKHRNGKDNSAFANDIETPSPKSEMTKL